MDNEHDEVIESTGRGAEPCAWCHVLIRYRADRATVLIWTGTGMMERGPFHVPACLADFQAARAQILKEITHG